MGSNFEIDVSKLELEESISEYLRSLPKRDLWKYVYDEYYVKQHLSGIKIAGILGCKSYCVYDYFKKFGFSSRSYKEMREKYKCDESFFDIIDTEEKAYWLGFMYADGFISKAGDEGSSRKVGLSIAECDKTHLEKLKTALKAENPIHTYKVSNGYNLNSVYCRMLICSEQLVNGLIDKGCTEHKTDVLRYPTENQVPLELQKHFIRGYFDGDGSIAITKPNNRHNNPMYTVKICGTNDILIGIQNFLLNENIIQRNYPFQKRKEGQIVSSFEVGGNIQACRVLLYLYGDATIYLDRKHERFLQLTEYIKLKSKEGARHIYDELAEKLCSLSFA